MSHYHNFSYDSKNGGTVKTEPSSNYDHYETSLGTIYSFPIAIGDRHSTKGKKMEFLQEGAHFLSSIKTKRKWNVNSDYPFVEERIFGYSMVNLRGRLYLFGK